jgi:ribosomal protein L27
MALLIRYASKLRLIEGHPNGDAEEEKLVGAEGEDGFDASAGGIVYQERGDDCAHFGFDESFAQGAGIGDADADVLYQSRGTRVERGAAGGVGEG